MGLLFRLAYAVFWTGFFVQAFYNLYFGIAITATGALLHIAGEFFRIYELGRMTDRVVLESYVEAGTRNALWSIGSGLLLLAAIWFFRGLFPEGTWWIYLANQAAYIVITVLPALAKILLARAKM